MTTILVIFVTLATRLSAEHLWSFQMVVDNLWKLYPPEPASEEEQALESKQKQAADLEKARDKVLHLLTCAVQQYHEAIL